MLGYTRLKISPVSRVATFLPLIFVFYGLIGLIEDSGYLPRAAFLMDGLMRPLGLDGRVFVLQVMGFGCNVPSIMGTRVIRDRSMRLLAMLCIPFALCQARLTVYIFLAGVFFPRPWWAPGLVLFSFYLLSFVPTPTQMPSSRKLWSISGVPSQPRVGSSRALWIQSTRTLINSCSGAVTA